MSVVLKLHDINIYYYLYRAGQVFIYLGEDPYNFSAFIIVKHPDMGIVRVDTQLFSQ